MQKISVLPDAWMGKVEILCHIFYGVRCFLCVQSIDLVYKAEFSVQKKHNFSAQNHFSVQSKLLVYTADY